MKIRVTIDLDKAEKSISEATWEMSGCYGIDEKGVSSSWYGNRTNWVEFEDVEIINPRQQKATGNAIALVYQMSYSDIPGYCAPKGHPQKVMKELGIKYLIAVPQSINDTWEFWGCSNVPEKLPSYLREAPRDISPEKHIGWGLSQEDADVINKWRKDYGM